MKFNLSTEIVVLHAAARVTVVTIKKMIFQRRSILRFALSVRTGDTHTSYVHIYSWVNVCSLRWYFCMAINNIVFIYSYCNNGHCARQTTIRSSICVATGLAGLGWNIVGTHPSPGSGQWQYTHFLPLRTATCDKFQSLSLSPSILFSSFRYNENKRKLFLVVFLLSWSSFYMFYVRHMFAYMFYSTLYDT